MSLQRAPAEPAADGRLLTLPGGRDGIKVRMFDSKAEAGAWLAADIASTLSQAIEARGKALWLGCGGTTPRPVYERLAGADVEWPLTALAQVDERFVPVDDARSNTLMMREALEPILDGEDGPGMALYSLIEDITDQDKCAALAEKTLLELGGGKAPVFDFALMGMGPDAHYASIFPGHPVNAFVYDTRALVLPVAPAEDGSEPVLPRITLTVPAILNSQRIVFLIFGEAKLDMLKSHGTVTDPFISPIGAFLARCTAPVEFVWAA
ncbi:MAG: 6-phosphogluconolactonase [Asticcacaulis sp.]